MKTETTTTVWVGGDFYPRSTTTQISSGPIARLAYGEVTLWLDPKGAKRLIEEIQNIKWPPVE